VSNVLDSLIAAGNSFQMVGAEKLKERLLKLIVQEGIHKRFWLAERRQSDGWYTCRRFLRYGGMEYYSFYCFLLSVKSNVSIQWLSTPSTFKIVLHLVAQRPGMACQKM